MQYDIWAESGWLNEQTMEINVALYERIRSYFELRLEDFAVSQIQGIPINPEISTEVKEILQELRHISPLTHSGTHSGTTSAANSTADKGSSLDLAKELQGDQLLSTQLLGDHLDQDQVKNFGQRLFETWRSLAVEEIGESFWSYPITIAALAAEMSVSLEQFTQYLDLSDLHTSLPSLQVLKNRLPNSQALTFHPFNQPVKANPTSQKISTKKPSHSSTKDLAQSLEPVEPPKFIVGDRVRINQQRPQYANHTGTVTQVISVSCRVALDNGWSAFLPHHCLEKI